MHLEFSVRTIIYGLLTLKQNEKIQVQKLTEKYRKILYFWAIKHTCMFQCINGTKENV